MEDANLVRDFQQGDETAFEQLYLCYKQPAMRTAYLICGNLADAENVLQDSFFKCYKALGSLHNGRGFKAWFWRILTRTAWDYCQKRNREYPTEEVLAAEDGKPQESLLDNYIGREEAARIMAAVDRLPLKQKTVIVLYYYNELSVKEIAEATDSLAATVKSRLYLARRSLQGMLQDVYEYAEAAEK